MESRPLLIYDGDCGFCRRWIARWKKQTGSRVTYAPFQEVAGRFPEIGREQFETGVVLLEPGGTIYSGAEAVFRILSAAGRRSPLLWLYQNAPGGAAVAEWIYRFVARRRIRFSRWISILSGPDLEPPTFFRARVWFFRLLGLVYFLAFASLGVQILGLIGENGILPAQTFLDQVGARFGPRAYHLVPTLFWWGASDFQLKLVCGAGMFLSLVLISGTAPLPVLGILWALYLSLVNVGRWFLRFQWDSLLLETGFLAILMAPFGFHPARAWRRPLSAMALWLPRWLLFRIMFQSGVVKLTSGDPSWRNLTALRYHFETQPLPTSIAWYAHNFPGWALTSMVALTFFIELAVPFFLFGPRRLRQWACAILILFQGAIIVTGNYGFFNLLAIALCLLLLDDRWWLRWSPDRLVRHSSPIPGPAREPAGKRWATITLAILILAVSIPQTWQTFDRQAITPAPIQTVLRWISPFRSVNRYGLFAVMTTARPEIQVEGSNNGTEWTAYSFRWKPGNPGHRPRFVAPHMPRLDWQMWFAALGSYRRQPWFLPFERRLLQGSPEVLGLLRENPFPDAPPRYIRAVLYRYRFTGPATRRASGNWWRRERVSVYTPAISLERESAVPRVRLPAPDGE